MWTLELGGHAAHRAWRTTSNSTSDRLAKSNAELVGRLRDLCGNYGRHAATPKEARAILGLTAN